MDKIILRVKDMDCAAEVATLKRELEPLVGDGSRLSFDILERRVMVDVEGLNVREEDIMKAIAKTGMQADSGVEIGCACCGGTCPTGEGFWQQHGRLILCILSGVLLLTGFALVAFERGGVLSALAGDVEGEHAYPLSAALLWLGSILSGIWYVMPKAWGSLRRLRPDMNLLMTIAVVGAVMIGELFEAASVAFLFSLANLLESWSIGRARRAIQSLMSITPSTALAFDFGRQEFVEKPVGDIKVGERILVRPGDKLPLDGIVLKGSSSVDQSPITGESVPVMKEPDDQVFAGTLNGDGSLEFRSTKPASDTTLARIIHMVETAQSRRAPMVQWIEKFAAIYTPAMVLMAALIAIVPPLAFGGSWSDWFYEALVILVIACPCAMVISTPVCIVTGISAAARNGVLIKGGVFLELPGELTAMAFDKTGTLTRGKPEVKSVQALDGRAQAQVLALAAALESQSTHPLARAIVGFAQAQGVDIPQVHEFTAFPGMGARGRIAGSLYWIGSPRMLKSEFKGHLPAVTSLENGEATSHVYLWDEERVHGYIGLADSVRPEAKNLVKDLKDLGIGRVIMLSGDNRPTAERIAHVTGVSEIRADLMPEDKTRAVQELVDNGERVAMIGDGVNDAPALAIATVGIAMGAMGTDVAIETADVALMSDDLSKLPWLIRHSRRALGIIRQNIVFALGLKVIFLILAVTGLATLWMAIVADMGASLLVIFNSLRLMNAGGRT
ncbi:heavy metal translocating P-type ATPase [Desulfocurvibacter africanus]|uniref:heavy metal translocating P-type ATPase n=1 Tax=Desulfocurvibacter africanus TaxID=873 RepID=UPI00041DDF71|nr:heavy metal translocating P-type ATPase [Desulfocurvibacter africanus]